MEWAAKIIIGIIAIMHVYYLYFEVFAWETIGRRIFGKGYTKEFFTQTKVLAANQGTYNGFLSAGLIWSLFIQDMIWRDYVALFFLSCVLIAGIVGAITADKKIFFIQGVPALIGMVLVLLNH